MTIIRIKVRINSKPNDCEAEPLGRVAPR